MITKKPGVRDGPDITHVSHDLNVHRWQFHYADEMLEIDAMFVSLKSIVANDFRRSTKGRILHP